MIRSLSESIKTSELLSEMDIQIFTNANFNTHSLDQLTPEEVRQGANIVKGTLMQI